MLAIAFGLQLIFGLQLGWFPIAGVGAGLQSYILPGFTLAAVSTALVARLLRNSLVETLGSDYVRTATAKGLPRGRVVGRHAMRNALIPVVRGAGGVIGDWRGGEDFAAGNVIAAATQELYDEAMRAFAAFA